MQKSLAKMAAFSVLLTIVALEHGRAQTGNCAKLVGTWRLVSAVHNNEPRQDVRKSETHIKHVTDTHFTWVIYKNDTKEVVAALGGRCSVSRESYTEIPQYGLGDALTVLRDKEQKFTWRVEGDRWYLKGRLSQGMTLEEVWERVKN